MSAVLYNFFYYIIFTVLIFVLIGIIFDRLSNSVDTKVVEMDGMHYMVPYYKGIGKDPRMIKDTGSIIACESLAEIMNQKVKLNASVSGAKSMNTGNSLNVDCYHPMTNTMVDYKPESFYKFTGKDINNSSHYEFYDRLALDEVKKQTIYEKNINYIEIPYLVDMCTYDPKNKEYSCSDKKDINERKKIIKNYLQKKLVEIF